MTTDTLERTDTGSFAPVRLHTAQPSHGNPLTGWMPPSSWADEPTPLYDSIYPEHAAGDGDYDSPERLRLAVQAEQQAASVLDAFVAERAQWARAELRELIDGLAAEQAAQHAATTYAQLPPNPAGQLAPEALDAEHQQRQADQEQEHRVPALDRTIDHRRRRPAPQPGPEPRRLLRDELAEFWADLKRLPSELRSLRPRRKGDNR